MKAVSTRCRRESEGVRANADTYSFDERVPCLAGGQGGRHLAGGARHRGVCRLGRNGAPAPPNQPAAEHAALRLSF